jgi:prepilin-type processing-associated H-X9-DG protein
VVIAIIGVLAGLLLPVLAKAKGAANRIGCLSRMHQWALAFKSYVDDNEDRLPREGFHADGETYWNNWSQVRNDASRDVWYNALSNYVGKPPASSYAPSERRPAFYQRGSFFHCPSARFPKEIDTPIAIFSLAMNSQLIHAPRIPTTTFARIKQPTQTVLFLDNLLDDEEPVVDDQAKTYLGQPASYANRFAGLRHGRTGNLAFADGHTESVLGTRVVETQGKRRGMDIWPPVDIFWEPDL